MPGNILASFPAGRRGRFNDRLADRRSPSPIAGGDILSTQKSWSKKCSQSRVWPLPMVPSPIRKHFYWQETGGQHRREPDEIIFIDRYKQAAADIDSRPVGSHISEASFETSLEAIKRRAHFLRSSCHLVVAGHHRPASVDHRSPEITRELERDQSKWMVHLSAELIRASGGRSSSSGDLTFLEMLNRKQTTSISKERSKQTRFINYIKWNK